MLRQVLLLFFNFYILIPVVSNCFRTTILKVIISFWTFWLTSQRILILRFNCCGQIFSIHSLKSAFFWLFFVFHQSVVEFLNFLLLRNRKHEAALVSRRYFSFRTFKSFVKLLFNRKLSMILICEFNQFLLLSIAIDCSINEWSLKFLSHRLNRLTSCFQIHKIIACSL